MNAERVRRLRERDGLFSQAEFSEATARADSQKCGVGARVIWDAENDKPVTPRTWRLIAQTLNVKPEDLLRSQPAESRIPRWLPIMGGAVVAAILAWAVLASIHRAIGRPAGALVFEDLRNQTTVHGRLALSADLLCRNLTIAPSAVVTTDGYSILCSGVFENHGRIITGLTPYQDYPRSYGGSGGGGGAECNGIGGQGGYGTLIAGGSGATAVTNGTSPQVPALSGELLWNWYARGMARYLSGAPGGGNPAATYRHTGTPGAFGVYIQARRIVAGNIVAAAPNACDTSGCGPRYGSAGGGGGVIVLAYGNGGIVPGTYDVRGGRGNPGGCYPSGRGGHGNVVAYNFRGNPPIDIPQLAAAPRVRSREDCVRGGPMGIINNTQGTVALLSGDGDFASLSPQQKDLVVRAGAILRGHLRLEVVNGGLPVESAPLIAARSWGPRRTGWFTVARSVDDGSAVYDPYVEITLPRKPGDYALIFAFQLSPRGDDIASGTNWVTGPPRWKAGDAIADYTPLQITDAQSYGCAVARRLVPGGTAWYYVPSDALRIDATAQEARTGP
ncbi:MAG: helix-turn-helix domain-containing protein [Vulcanimicrobiaceae bacterium]